MITPKQIEEKMRAKVAGVLPSFRKAVDGALERGYCGKDTLVVVGVRYPFGWNETDRAQFDKKAVGSYAGAWKVNAEPYQETVDRGLYSEATVRGIPGVRAFVIRHPKARNYQNNFGPGQPLRNERDLVDLGEIEKAQ